MSRAPIIFRFAVVHFQLIVICVIAFAITEWPPIVYIVQWWFIALHWRKDCWPKWALDIWHRDHQDILFQATMTKADWRQVSYPIAMTVTGGWHEWVNDPEWTKKTESPGEKR